MWYHFKYYTGDSSGSHIGDTSSLLSLQRRPLTDPLAPQNTGEKCVYVYVYVCMCACA